MSPAPCRQCGKEISTEDPSCPHCGATQLLSPLPSEPPGETPPRSSFRRPPPPPRPPAPQIQPLETLDAEAPSSTFTLMHGVLAVGALVIIAILWYGIFGRSSGEKPAASSAPPPVSSPAPSQEAPAAAAPVPGLTAAERQAASEVLDVLKGLQSMTTGDVNFREYVSRVRNVKVPVEQYLQAEGGDRVIKARVYDAMILHLLAAAAWNAKMANKQTEYEAIGSHSALALCPDLRPLLDVPPPPGVERTPEANRGVNAAENLDRIWSCAAGKIADAEEALKARSG